MPVGHRRVVFDQVHGLAHAGTRATTRLLNSRYVWHGLAADVKNWCQQCVECQRAKVTHHEKASIQKIPIPAQRFSHVHVDLVGPLPVTSSGMRYLLTMIDRSTRWFEAIPLASMTAEVVLETFIATWVSRFGVPAKVTTDQGTQFTSGTWASWCVERGIEHIKTTAYHPKSNGMVERLHRQIKEALRAKGAENTWADHLPWVLLGLRAAPKDETGISTAEATLGQQLIMPGQIQKPDDMSLDAPRAPPAVIPETKRSYAEVVGGRSDLDRARMVYVRRGGVHPTLQPSYDGPFHVLESGRCTFKIRVGDREEVVSRERLKPQMGNVDPDPQIPKKRGRPPKI